MRAAVIVKVQVFVGVVVVDVQSPAFQPSNVVPAGTVAVKVTDEP
jgi:hypothetical protein